MTPNDFVTWTVFLSAMSIVFGLLAVLWGYHERHVGKIYERMLDDTKQRHAFELEVAKGYARTESLRAAVDSALEPIRVELRHLGSRMDDLQDEVGRRLSS